MLKFSTLQKSVQEVFFLFCSDLEKSILKSQFYINHAKHLKNSLKLTHYNFTAESMSSLYSSSGFILKLRYIRASLIANNKGHWLQIVVSKLLREVILNE